MTTAEYSQTPESLAPTELIYGKLRVAESPDGLLDLHDALTRFATAEPLKAKLVELRSSPGCQWPRRRPSWACLRRRRLRWWEFARLWLFADLRVEDNLATA